jgi:hypothetical protein
MTILLAMPLAALLAATGIYNPQVMRHGRCMAEPGSLYALLYCTPPAAPPHQSAR